MNDRQIIFGPGDKLRWLEGVVADRRARPFDVRLAVAISNRIDKFTGAAVIGQEWLASYIGGTARGVRKSADHLEATGHVAIERSEGKTAFGGRGKANVYRPKTRNGGSGFECENPERRFRVYGTETRNCEALNPEQRSTKPGTAVPPLPNRSPKFLPKGGGGGDDTVLGEHPEGEWRTILSVLGNHLTIDELRAWFDDVELSEISDREVVLIAPTRFKATYLENHYGSHVLAAARRCRSSITDLRFVVVANMRAAE